jgi:hypothetical protein
MAHVLRAHWQALVAADFLTTEVWTVRGVVTDYTVFVIELHSRRVHVLGSTTQPDEAFVIQTMRHLTDDVDGVLRGNHLLICDRDRKWSAAVERFLATGGVRLIRTPFLAPNCNGMRSGSYAPLKRNASIASSRSVNDTFAERFPSSSRITTASGTTKGSTTSSSIARQNSTPAVPFVGASESVDFSATTAAPPPKDGSSSRTLRVSQLSQLSQ